MKNALKRLFALLLTLVMVLQCGLVTSDLLGEIFADDAKKVTQENAEPVDTVPEVKVPFEGEEPKQEDETAEKPDPEPEDGRITLSEGCVSIRGILPESGSVSIADQREAEAGPKKSGPRRSEDPDERVVLASYDITILDAEGNPWQPEEPVEVTITSENFVGVDSVSVYHEGELLYTGVKPEGDTVSFMAESFSIYEVTAEMKIVTVNFYDEDGNLVGTEYIKDIENQTLYSPQEWELDYGEEFFGWSEDQNAAYDEALKIEDLDAAFKANWNSYSTDVPVSYHAIVRKVYVVTFNRYDDGGNLVVLDTVTVPVEAENKTITIPDDLGSEIGDAFLGWLSQDGTQYSEGSPYTVTGHVSFYLRETGRYWLVFDSNAGGPGSGVTYTPPQLIFGAGIVTEKPNDPERAGFNFTGWNTDPDGNGTSWLTVTYDGDGNPIYSDNNFGGVITEDVTLYAQWEGKQTSYYVLFWQQSVTDEPGLPDDQKTYVYVESSARTAVTGETVPTTYADRNKGGVTGSEYGYYFTYNANRSDTSAIVAANGTTVLNVYYDRREITYNFNGAVTYSPTTSTSGTQYGLVDGKYVLLTRSGSYNNYTWSYGTGVYNDVYDPTTSNSGTQYGLVDGEYVQLTRSSYLYTEYTGTSTNITGYGYYNGSFGRIYYRRGSWRTTDNNNGPVYNGTVYTRSSSYSTYYWYIGEERYEDTRFTLTSTEIMEDYTGTRYTQGTGNLTFTGLYKAEFNDWPSPGSGKVWKVTIGNSTRYYPIPFTIFDPASCSIASATATSITFTTSSYDTNYELIIYKMRTDGTWGYTSSDVLAATNWGGGSWTPSETFEGFTVNGYRTGSTSGTWSDATPTTSIQAETHLYLRYSRNQHSIQYISEGVNTTGRTEHTVSGVYYGSSLESYDDYVPTNGRDGYAFTGWYADENGNVPFDFSTTMPDHDVTVYAKWETQRTRVVLDPNAPEGQYSLANNQSLSFRLDYNETIDGTNITGSAVSRTGYILDGWYTVEGNHLWNFETHVNRFVSGVDDNYQNSPDWELYGDNDGEHDNVIAILKLKAKWKLNVQENSVYVIYKVPEAYCVYKANGSLQTQIPIDETAYALQEGVTSVTLQTAGDPSDYKDGYEFTSWALLNPDGSKSGRTVEHATTTSIEDSYFKEEVLTDDEGNTAVIRYIVFEAQFAPYQDKATMVVFNGNGGTTDAGASTVETSYLVNESFEILPADTFTREGFEFVGWNTKADGSGHTFAAGITVAADNLQDSENGFGWDENEEKNVVYALWKTTYSVTIESTPATLPYNGTQQENNNYTVHYWATANGVTTEISESELEGVTVSFSSSGDNGAEGTSAGEEYFKAVGTDVGTYTTAATVSLAMADGYTGQNTIAEGGDSASADIVLNITPIDAVVTITGHHSTDSYDGDPHTITGYEVTSVTVNGEESSLYGYEDIAFSGTASATRTNVVEGEDTDGRTDMGLAPSQFSNTNPNFANVTFIVVDGYQEITPVSVVVTIIGHHSTDPYDGHIHTVTGYEVTLVTLNGEETNLYTPIDFSFSGEATASRTNVAEGSDTDGRTDMGLTAAQFTNTNPNFTDVVFQVTDGYQIITPIDVTVTIVGHHSSDPYDGNVHTVSGYDVTNISSPLYTAADFSFNGEGVASRTNVVEGSDTDGQTDMGLTAEQFTNNNTNFANVTFSVTDGYQKITPVGVVVTIVGNHSSDPYDGAAHTVTGYEVTNISSTLYTEADFSFTGEASATRTNVVEGSDTDGKTDMGLTASQFTNTNPNFADVTFSVTDGYQEITPVDVEVTITGHHFTNAYDGHPHTANGYDVTSVKIGGEESLLYTQSDIAFSGTASATRTNVVEGEDADGRTDMGLAPSQFSNTNPNFANVTFIVIDGYQEITPIDVTVTIVGHHSTDPYDGNVHTVTGYDVTNISNALYTEADFSFNGEGVASRTNVVEGEDTDGQTDMGLTAEQFTNNNPNFGTVTFSVTDGYQRITPLEVTVTIVGHHSTVPYDGSEHSVRDYEVTSIKIGGEDTNLYTREDFSFSGTAEASRTNVVEGEDADGRTDMGLNASQFTNTNPNFSAVTFVVTDGYQEITPIDVTVTIVGNHSSDPYDGNSHVVVGYEVTNISSSLYTTADFSFNGEATATRTNVVEGEDSDGQTDMGLTAEQFTNNNPNFANVTFSVTDGYQRITPIDVTVTIVGKNSTDPYDGAAHTVTGYEVTNISNDLYTEADFSFSGEATATRTNVVEGEDTDGQTDMGLAASQFTNNNPNFATVTFEVTDGYQKITPIDVTVTIVGKHSTDPYDGNVHTVSGYEVTNISNRLYTASDFSFNGEGVASRTNVVEGTDADGQTDMGLTASQFTNNNPNFANVTFNVTDGYQRITPIDVTVTIVGKNSTDPYDGAAHTVTGYEVTNISSTLYTEADFSFSGEATATRTNVVEGTDADGQTDMGLKASQFTNNNTNFATVTFEVTDGYQKITPIDVTVTIVGKNSTDPYDGAAHTVTGYEVTNISNDLYTEADFSFSGEATASRTNVVEGGDTDGQTDMGLAASQFTNNNPNFATVTFNVTDGYQKITPIDVTVTIVGNHSTDLYDGETHIVSGYEVTSISSRLYTTADFSFNGEGVASRTNFVEGSDTDGQTDMGLTAEQFTNNNPNFGTVTFEVTDGYQRITKRTVVLTSATDNKVYDGSALTNHTVSVSGDGFVSGEGATYDVTGTQTEVGHNENRFTYTLNEGTLAGNYDISTVFGTLTVTADTKLIAITSATKNWEYDGENHTEEVYTVKYDGTTLTPDATGRVFTLPTGDTITITPTAAGVKYVADSSQGNNTYTFVLTNAGQYTSVSVSYGTLSITKAPLTITADSDSKEYDGQPLTDSGWQDTAPVGLKGTDAVESVTVTGTITEVGTEDNIASNAIVKNGDTDVTANYDINYVDGTLEITSNTTEIVITSATQSWEYDGENHKEEVYTVTYGGQTVTADSTGKVFTLPTGDTITITPTAEGVKYVADSAENNNTFTYALTNADQYAGVGTEIGSLSITKAPLTITADSDSKEYDGTPLTDSGWQDTAPVGLKGSDAVETVTVTGTITEVGTEDNVASGAVVKNGETDVTANYEINYVDGTLEITANTTEIVITSATQSWEYDGELHKEEVYTVTYGDETITADSTGKVFTLPTGDTITITPTAEGVKYVADSAEKNNTFTYVLTNEDQYAEVSTEIGSLSITKAPLTITADSDSKEYDGTPLTDSGWQDTAPAGLKGTDIVESVTVTGTITEVGTEDNVANAAVVKNGDTDVTANYEINYVDGILEITASTKALTITSATKSWEYDGENHTEEVYTVKYDGTVLTPDETGKVFTLPTGDTITITPTAAGVKYVADSSQGNNTYTFVLTNAGQYTSVSVSYGTLSITKAPLTITADSDSKEYDGQPLTDDGWQDTPPAGLKGTDTVESVTVTGTITEVGTEDNVASAAVVKNGDTDVTANYDINYVDGTLEITANATEIVISSATQSWEYDGENHKEEVYTVTYGGQTVTADSTGKVFTLPTGDTITITPTAEGVKYVADSAENNNTFTYVLTNEDQYSGVSTEIGSLSITKAPLTITADSDSKEYDGIPLTDFGWQDTAPVGLKGSDAVESVTVTGTITEVGTEDNVASAAVVKNGDTDVTANYEINYVDGVLEITANATEIVITSATKSWEYDGELHKEEVYTVTYGRQTVTADSTGKVFTLPTGDTITITSTAAGVKYVADSAENNNTYTYVLTNEDQYAGVSTEVGSLSITKASLTITADSDSKEYDGTPLTDSGWQDTAPVGLKGTDAVESVTVTGTITEVGTEDNVASGAVVKNGDTDVTANYDINYVDGTLEITTSTKTLTITSATKSWEYDGENHTEEVYTVTYGNETIAADSTGKVFTLPTGDMITITPTAAGVKYVADSSQGNNTYTFVLTNAGQYSGVSVSYGTLSITKAPLTITADSNNKEYDGTPLTDSGWQDTAPVGLKGTDTVESVTVTGTITEVGTEDNVASAAVVKNGDTDVTANYDINYVDGTLEITANTTEIVISSATQSWEYDGENHTEEVYTVTYGNETIIADSTGKVFTLPTGDTITITPTEAGVKYVADTAEGNNTFTYALTNADQYAGVSTEVGSLSITKASLTITADSDSKEYDGQPLTDSGWQDTPPAGLKGTDAVESVTVTGTITDVGTEDNVASSAVVKNGDTDVTANYDINYVDGTLEITASTKTLTITSATKSWEYDGENHKEEVYTVTYGNMELTADSTGMVFTLPTGDTITITPTAEGVKYVADSAEKNNTFTYVLTNEDQYSGVSTSVGSLSITKAPLTITADSDSKEYDGTPLTDDGWQDTPPAGLKGTDAVESVTVTGTITDVGTEDNIASNAIVKNGDTDVTANYDINYIDGTLEITANATEIVITSATQSWEYDGENHKEEVYTVTYGGQTVTADSTGMVFTLPTGDTITITPTAEGVKYVADSAENNNTFTYALTNADQYAGVGTEIGSLSITKALLTITADSDSKEYDGTPLTDSGWQDTAPVGLKGSDAVETVTVTGTITEVGTEDNVASGAVVKNGDTDVTANYDINYVDGVLEITANATEIVITSATKSWEYDGELHKEEVYTVTYGNETIAADSTGKVFTLPTGDTITIIPTAEGVKYVADSAENNNTFTYVLTNADQYSGVGTENGSLSITKAPLTITADSDSKEYDGTPLTDDGWKDTAPVGLKGTDEVSSVTVTGTITEVGTEDNVASGAVVKNGDTDVTANYEINYVDGVLEITANATEIVITSATQSWEYDGELHKEEVYTVTYGDETITADSTGKVFTLPTGDTITITPTAEGVKYVADSAENNNTYTYVLTNEDQYTGVSTEVGSLSITKAPLTITADSDSKEYDGQPLTDSGWQDTPPAGLKGTDTVESVMVTGTITEVGTEDNVASGAVVKNGDTDVTANYDINYVDGTLEITQSSKAIVITSATQSWEYDGELHKEEVYTVTYGNETIAADSTGKVFTLPTGDTITITPTEAGVKYVADTAEGNNTFTYALTNADQYASVSKTEGTLSITKAPLTITADSDSKEYDGQPLTDSGWQDTAPVGLKGTDAVESVTVTGTITEVGTEDNIASNAIVKNGNTDVTENYEITYEKGVLEITANTKAIVITSATKSWEYDGELHKEEVYTVTYDGETVAADGTGFVFRLPTRDVITITPTEDGVTYVSDNAEHNNTFSYTVTKGTRAVENDVSDQYSSLTTEFGTLSITKAPLTIIADSDSKEYDGTPLTDSGWQDTPPAGLKGTDEVASVTVTGTITQVGTEDNVASNAVVMNGDTDVTENYEISYEKGVLEVTKSSKALIIASGTKSFEYDGENHVYEVYTVSYEGTEIQPDESGLVFTLPTGDTITITPTAEGVKYVSDNEPNNNTYTYELTNAGHYDSLSAAAGTLSITKAPLTITADSDSKEYDGTPLTDSGWQDTAPVGLKGTDDITSVTVTGTITQVGTEDNVPSDAVVRNGELDVTENYNITYEKGVLEITKSTKALVISSATRSWEYDGELHTEEVYSVTFEGEPILPDESGRIFTLSTGDTIEITPTTEGVRYVSDSAEKNNTFSYELTNEEGYDSVSVAFGTLSITKAPLTITADSASKEYDETPLTDDGWQDTPPEGLKGTDEVTSVTVTGSITEIGIEDNVPSDAVVMNGDVDVTENYEITYVNGTLKVIEHVAPGTGDYGMIPVMLLGIMSLSMAITVAVGGRKSRKENE